MQHEKQFMVLRGCLHNRFQLKMEKKLCVLAIHDNFLEKLQHKHRTILKVAEEMFLTIDALYFGSTDHGSAHLLCICDRRLKLRLMGNHLEATERKTHFSYST